MVFPDGDHNTTWQDTRRPALLEQMLSYADSSCTNARDKIFVLLSLVLKDDPGRQRVGHNLNYALSALDLRTIRILGELLADSSAEVDMPFWTRERLVLFEEDANLGATNLQTHAPSVDRTLSRRP